MSNPPRLPVIGILAFILGSSATSAQEVPDKSLDENPYKDEKPRDAAKPAPAYDEKDRAWRAAIIAEVMAEPVHPHIRPKGPLSFEVVGLGQGDDARAPDGFRDGFAVDEPAGPPGPRAGLRVLAPDNFDRWVFGNKADRGSRLEWLVHRLDVRVGWAVRARRLAPAQADKLRLAGTGDVKRFFDRVEAGRREFEAIRSDEAAGRAFLGGGLTSLQVQFQEGPFGDGSLYARTLGKIENDR